jgi:transglutaminase-like putative cysteine protease
VLTREGAQLATHFMAEFDPLYQRLEVHFVRILRGDECFEHAIPGTIQMFRRETDLERLALNGRLTASLLIPDVRVDDIVEISLTLYGDTPVLGGRYAGWVAFDCFTPCFENRHRLLRPLARKINIKAYNGPPAPDIAVTGDVEDLRWQIVGQKRRDAEELTPPWLVQVPSLQFSEFESWNDVACLFSPFYEDDTIPEGLAEEIDQLATAYEDLEERAAEWLRFVQQNLRYFAFSLGEGGLMPRELDAIWRTRFGDCKDAAKLYMAGARRLGLDVCAALVSTTHGRALGDFVPSSSVFNHCIVRLRLNGASYWLDPTMPMQSGDLRNIFQPHDGWALPLTREIIGLEKIGSETPLHVIHREDRLRLGPKRDSLATLTRRVECFSWIADLVRNRAANEGAAAYVKGMLEELQVEWPSIRETKPIEIHDDRIQNCITLILSYEIPDCWKRLDDGKRLSLRITDAALNSELTPLKGIGRQTEIFLGRPRKVTRYVRIDMPCKWRGGGWLHNLEKPGLSYVDDLTINEKTIGNSKELVIAQWSISAVQASAYNYVANRLRENSLTVPARERFGKIRPIAGRRPGLAKGEGGVVAAAWLIIASVLIFFFSFAIWSGWR